MQPSFQLEFVWMREDEEGVELVPLTEAVSPIVPRLGESIEFDLPEAQSEQLPDSWVVVDLNYTIVKGESQNELSSRITVFVDVPLEEEEEEE